MRHLVPSLVGYVQLPIAVLTSPFQFRIQSSGSGLVPVPVSQFPVPDPVHSSSVPPRSDPGREGHVDLYCRPWVLKVEELIAFQLNPCFV